MMKMKALFLLGCLMSATVVFADANHHYFGADNVSSHATKKGLKWASDCEIEIINDSFTTVRVYGTLGNGLMLRPFNIYTYEYPHYISLYYYGYCYAGMDLYIDTWNGYPLYAGYTMANTTIHIVPAMMKEKPKIEVIQKQKNKNEE